MDIDLRKCSDEELAAAFQCGDEAAGDYLLEKYKALVKKKARLYYLEGGDHEDLLQEGMLGLYKAIREYSPKKDASFTTFANLCVNRQMLSAIQAAGRKKHRALNESVPLEQFKDSYIEGSVGTAPDPETIFVEQENAAELRGSIEKDLSAMERKVLGLYLEGLDYRRIAQKMGKTEKSIDNALQRVRGKLKRR